ncbi:MAG: GFA family protein [Gammaproteobacteria bacterium]
MSGAESTKGGCACGAIRYEFSGDTIVAVNCHCRDCQRASGSAYASLLIVLEESFRFLNGEPKFHEKSSDRGTTMRRGFCADCGSPIILLEPHRPKWVFLQAASLDDPSVHKPTMDIFTASANPWDVLDSKLEQFPAMPPIPDEAGT